MNKQNLAILILRIGIGIVFIYAAIASYVYPQNWIGYFPDILKKNIDNNILLNSFAIYEIILGSLIILGFKLYYTSILAVLTLFSIILTNINLLDLIFRDIAIMLSAISLWLLSKR